jgi:hypothetical protein
LLIADQVGGETILTVLESFSLYGANFDPHFQSSLLLSSLLERKISTFKE